MSSSHTSTASSSLLSSTSEVSMMSSSSPSTSTPPALSSSLWSSAWRHWRTTVVVVAMVAAVTAAVLFLGTESALKRKVRSTADTSHWLDNGQSVVSGVGHPLIPGTGQSLLSDTGQFATRTHQSTSSLVSRLQLLDLRQCRTNRRGSTWPCSALTQCQEVTSPLLCRCPRGYYLHDRQCLECRLSCPDGYHLVTPCSETADAVCTPCSTCSSTQYEAAACSSTQDTVCVDVTFPTGALPTDTLHCTDDGSRMTVSYSHNVVLERPVVEKELETPMYVTNNQQTQDFVWHRRSGIDIVLGISGVQLIPVYREVDVADDSDFILSPGGRVMMAEEGLRRLNGTRKNYCSHPLPDYYYLHLQVLRNRVAAGRVVRCDSRGDATARCPKPHKDGDRYLQFNFNTPCEKLQKGKMEQLTDTHNSVVCGDETEVDRDIFQLPRPVTEEYLFERYENCSEFRHQCQGCLRASRCTDGDQDESCCGLSCYTQGACHNFYSHQCPPLEVECAKGEVRVFTLIPMFTSMSEEFTCPLHYVPPTYLYNISYALSIPSLGLQLPVQTYSAPARSLQQHQRHSAAFHFIQVWHDTRLAVFDHVLLKGRHAELEATSNNHMQPFVLHSLKERAQLARKSGYFSTAKGRGQWATAVQFERPFAYSSTSWFRDGCHKNVSAIFPNQTIYRNDAVKVTAKKVDRGGNFWYQVSHHDRSPYIKLSVPAGQSVLRWFQGQMTHGTIVGEELSADLTWNVYFLYWSITVTGAVQTCPAILTVQIFNKNMSSCMGVFDVLVTCPRKFSMTFNLSRTEGDLPDTFVVLLNDTVASHRLVLSSVLSPVSVGVTSAARGQQLSQTPEDRVALWWPVLVVLLLFVVATVAVVGVYTHISHTASIASRSAFQQDSDPSSKEHTEAAALNKPYAETASLDKQTSEHPPSSAVTSPTAGRPALSPHARKWACIFVCLYVLYSVTFTFSVTLTGIYVTYRALAREASQVVDVSATLQKQLNASLEAVTLHEEEEVVQLYRSVDSRLQACSHHLQQQNEAFTQVYQGFVTDLLAHVYGQQEAIDSMTGQALFQNTSVYAEEIHQFVDNCNKTVQSILNRFDAFLRLEVKELARKAWLDFPREVFLAMEGDPVDSKYMSSDQLVRFLHWLRVDKVEELFSVSDTIAGRLATYDLPSANDHLKYTVTSPYDEFTSTPLPTVAKPTSHTVLVVGGGDRDTAVPPSTADSETPSSQGRGTGSYGEGHPDTVKVLHSQAAGKDYSLNVLGSGAVPAGDAGTSMLSDGSDSAVAASHVRKGVTSASDVSDSDVSESDISQPASHQETAQEEEEGFSVEVYAMLGLFLLLDVLLFAFRMWWLVTQLRAARAGYEDRIPTDPVCQKLLAIQTGYHVNHMQDMYRSYSYSLENRENVASERKGVESTFALFVSPDDSATKDDILRVVMAQKMNSADQICEPNVAKSLHSSEQMMNGAGELCEKKVDSVEESLGQEVKNTADYLGQSGEERGGRYGLATSVLHVHPPRHGQACSRQCCSGCYWLQRLLTSQLAWQLAVTVVVVVCLCGVVVAADRWLHVDSVRVLVGSDTATRDLRLQIQMTNHHLSRLASHLTAVLQEHMETVQREILLSTTLLTSTLTTQRQLLFSLLDRVCAGASTLTCNTSTFTSLPLPVLPTWQGCSFLPVQPQLFSAVQAGQVDLDGLVEQQLSPLLAAVRHWLVSLCAVLMALLCVMFLCHCGATVARYYMLVWGHLPRVAIFQISENSSLMYDGRPDPHKPMQRSASWLESCESGVYVGENDLDNTFSRDHL